MSAHLVTSYAASRLLGRDRQTIERAVRHLAPDAFENGRPRWKLERIAAAVAMKPHERREAGRLRDRFNIPSKALDGLRLTFEMQLAAISAEPSLDKRRDMALSLAPLLAEYQRCISTSADRSASRTMMCSASGPT